MNRLRAIEMMITVQTSRRKKKRTFTDNKRKTFEGAL